MVLWEREVSHSRSVGSWDAVLSFDSLSTRQSSSVEIPHQLCLNEEQNTNLQRLVSRLFPGGEPYAGWFHGSEFLCGASRFDSCPSEC